MSESFLSMLYYLFDNYNIRDITAEIPQAILISELHDVGFSRQQARHMLEWLDNISRTCDQVVAIKQQSMNVIRVFSEIEKQKLELDVRSYIMSLEQVGMLDAQMREQVIDTAMALQQDCVKLPEVQCIVCFLLSDRDDRDQRIKRLQLLQPITGMKH